jgi:hypothetical protein
MYVRKRNQRGLAGASCVNCPACTGRLEDEGHENIETISDFCIQTSTLLS